MSLWTAEKRLLALDGGGVRGIVSIAFLERMGGLLKQSSARGTPSGSRITSVSSAA